MTYDDICTTYYHILTTEYLDRADNLNETDTGEIAFYYDDHYYGTGREAFSNSGWGAACDKLAEVAEDEGWDDETVERNIREDIENWINGVY